MHAQRQEWNARIYACIRSHVSKLHIKVRTRHGVSCNFRWWQPLKLYVTLYCIRYRSRNGMGFNISSQESKNEAVVSHPCHTTLSKIQNPRLLVHVVTLCWTASYIASQIPANCFAGHRCLYTRGISTIFSISLFLKPSIPALLLESSRHQFIL